MLEHSNGLRVNCAHRLGLFVIRCQEVSNQVPGVESIYGALEEAKRTMVGAPLASCAIAVGIAIAKISKTKLRMRFIFITSVYRLFIILKPSNT
jgi:hypothetical protein